MRDTATVGQRSVIIVSHLCPFPKNKGNAARLLCLLEWLRSRGFRLTFVLQPLDVEYPQFIPQLTTVVDELIVVQRSDFAERVHRATSLPIPIVRRILSGLRRRTISTAARSDYADLDSYCWPATIRAVVSAARRRSPDIIISEYAFFSRCFARVPRSTVKVIDTVEVFSRNTQQFAEVGVAANLVCTRASERTVLTRADLVIA